ncbi:integrase [Pseudomonas sp. NPDC086251]|uniref:integrase n=1 Tax=Pseudomonas sp. NPDC086251 TaxID=3364431 RepID=UPI003835B6A1
MSKIVNFTPKHELSAQQNLRDFIVMARESLTLWADLEGFAWDSVRWPTTDTAIRFTCFEHRNLHPSRYPEKHQVMHPEFAEVAKAYLRYKCTLRPQKRGQAEMLALRTIEYVLRQDMLVPDITKFGQRHWEAAVSTLEPLTTRQETCCFILTILKTLADFCILTVDPSFWKHPYRRLNGYNAANGTNAPNEARSKKAPEQDTLLAIAEVFSQGTNASQEDSDIMVTCVTGILLSAPMRIGETLRLRTDCLHEAMDKNGDLQYYLAYWVPKSRHFARKAIPKTMSAITKEAIKRLSEITMDGRLLARYMETDPLHFYRHTDCPNVPDDQELSRDQVAKALGFASRKSSEDFIKKHTNSYSLTGFTLDSLWKIVLIEHRARNPHFPFQEAPYNSVQLPLRMSDSLMCFRRLQLAKLTTSPVLLAPYTNLTYGQHLATEGKAAESMNFFNRNGYGNIKLLSHTLRHLLNRLGRSSGISVDMLTEWSSRAHSQQTRTYLHDDPIKAASKGAVLLGTAQEQAPMEPVSNEEVEHYGQGPFHRSRYGICRRSWRAGPCNKFADCLNCSELLMCKGDRIAAKIIKLDRDNLVLTYTAAQQAIAEGERAASLWTEKAGPQIDRLNQLLAILHNPEIPDGSPIEMAGEDFSHERLIVSEKAEAAGVKLLDKNKLRITYGDGLLACLELLRSSDNA